MNHCVNCEYADNCEIANDVNFCEDCADYGECSLTGIGDCKAGYEVECNNGFELKE